MTRMLRMLSCYVVFLLLTVFGNGFHGVHAQVDCSDFDASNIKLVTFDTFAALTLLVESLNHSISTYLPELNSTQVEDVVDQWIDAYAINLGNTFDVSVTGPYPFRWVVNTSIVDIIQTTYPWVPLNSSLVDLENSWGDLIPRPGANETLYALSTNGFQVGPLSNGDVFTLKQAFKAFDTWTIPDYIFTSDYPVMCFKNCSQIYQNVLSVTGYSPLEYLHVAGSDYDGYGARAAGVFSAVLNTEGKMSKLMTTEGSFYDNQYTPCYFLNQLTDLLPILGVSSSPKNN